MNRAFRNCITPELETFINNTNLFTKNGKLFSPGSFGNNRGVIFLSDEYIVQSGGLLRAISRKSTELLRRDLSNLNVKRFSSECCMKWKYILMHCQPHLDEYLSSFFLRACLPGSMDKLIVDETTLFSKDNDTEAQRIWPEAAVLGVGNTVNGGAKPLLLFDEHEANQDSAEEGSLIMLMKHFLLGSQRLPKPFYDMVREVNYIDQYGTSHPKSLAVYAKYIQATRLPTANLEEMNAEWKCAIMDAAFAAYYYSMRNEYLYQKKAMWEPVLTRSLEHFRETTKIRYEPEFQASFKKISNNLTKGFSYHASRGSLYYSIPNVKDPSKTSQETYHLLVPYLPNILFHLWGDCLGQLLVYPLWECRILHDIMFTRTYSFLEKNVSYGMAETADWNTDIGTISIEYTKKYMVHDKPIMVIDFEPNNQSNTLSAVNNFIKRNAEGVGISIVRNASIGSIIITKGEKIPGELWEHICEQLVKEEGNSDDIGNNGAWHITRNPSGLAPFILNGNPTHRYVRKSKVTVHDLVALIDSISSQDVS